MIVVDANLVIVAASGDPRRAKVQELFRGWIASGEEVHAPMLLPYEVANGLCRLIVAGLFPEERLDPAWQIVRSLSMTCHPLGTQGEEATRIALRLGRASAYDAAYIALAQELGAELWTFDGPLARNARSPGYPVQLVE